MQSVCNLDPGLAPGTGWVCRSCGVSKDRTFATVRTKDEGPATMLKVEVSFAGTACCPEATQAYLSELRGIYDRRRPFQVMYNALHIGMPSMAQVRTQVDFMRAMDTITREYVVSAAVVIRSKYGRKLLKGIFKVKPPACPLRVFSSKPDAVGYLAATSGSGPSSHGKKIDPPACVPEAR